MAINKKLKANSRYILKVILNLWTFVTFIIFTADFFSGNEFDSTASAIGVIYLAILGIYAGEKEYDRWQTTFTSRFIGESFVIMWTVMMMIFVILAPFSGNFFRVPAEFAIVYTSVVGVFALTSRSKYLHSKKHSRK